MCRYHIQVLYCVADIGVALGHPIHISCPRGVQVQHGLNVSDCANIYNNQIDFTMPLFYCDIPLDNLIL